MHSYRPGTDPVATSHAPSTGRASSRAERHVNAEQAAMLALDDCMFALGQAVGTRMTLDYEAVIWIRQHFLARFTHAIATYGNRWAQDRDNVTGAAFMLGERAVRYAGDASAISVAAVQRAAADVEHYCELQSRRVAKSRGLDVPAGELPRIAGYWCLPILGPIVESGGDTEPEEDTEE